LIRNLLLKAKTGKSREVLPELLHQWNKKKETF